MAEILGLISSIIAIGGVAGGTLKTLETVQNTLGSKDEIMALINEISDLRAVLHGVDTVIREADAKNLHSLEQTRSLLDMTVSAKSQLLELDKLIQYKIIKSPDPGSSYVQVAWMAWLKHKNQLRVCQEGLHRTKHSLSLMMNTVNLSGSSRIKTSINEVSIITQDIRAIQTQQNARLQQYDTALQTVSHQIGLLFTNHIQAPVRFQKVLAGTQNKNEGTKIGNSSTRYDFGRSRPTPSALGQDELPMETRMPSGTSQRGEPTDGPACRRAENEFYDQRLVQTSQGQYAEVSKLWSSQNGAPSGEDTAANLSETSLEPYLRVRTTQYQDNVCRLACGCICHKEHRLRTPQNLSGLIGSLFLGYSGLTAGKVKCSEKSCRRRPDSSLKFTYYFPWWFLARKVTMAVTLNSMKGPGLLLRVPRVIEDFVEVFYFSRNNNVEGLKKLFNRHLASPHDTHGTYGQTPLHFAILGRNYGVAKLLLNTGADPYVEDNTQQSPIDYLWDHRLQALGYCDADWEFWHSSIEDTDDLDRRGFSLLHRAILPLLKNNLSLSALLDTSTAMIDTVDTQGRTPLSWAAARDDAQSVKILLEKGAEVEICDTTGMTPLMYAALRSDMDCMQIILEAGADPNRRGIDQLTAMHHSAMGMSINGAHMDLLMRFGACLEAKDDRGRTPLIKTTVTGNAIAAAALLKHGADIEVVDKHGFTALHLAIVHSAINVLSLLLRSGACRSVQTNEKDTILHTATYYRVSIETIRVLTDAKLEELNVDDEDSYGRRAWEWVEWRKGEEGLSLEMIEAYEDLFESICPGYIFGEDSESVIESEAIRYDSDSANGDYEEGESCAEENRSVSHDNVHLPDNQDNSQEEPPINDDDSDEDFADAPETQP
ncbi:MAG: hypothetical protein M1827_004843 [Pycnora praestabilis]|nr:MAG: hypothetical protein M1827_004843 [Pycnora praestabilis]